MPEQTQTRTISHAGQELGSSQITRSQNQVSPQLETQILDFEVPTDIDHISYRGERHWTKAEFRGMVTYSADGDGTIDNLTPRLVPIAGEKTVADQPFPTAVVYNATSGNELTIDSIDYGSDTITLASSQTGGDTLKIYYAIAEGELKLQGVNNLDQVVGVADRWGTPLDQWTSFDQNKEGTEINLQGSIDAGHNESLQVLVDSPRQVVWTETDYPRGTYVSSLEQQVDITL